MRCQSLLMHRMAVISGPRCAVPLDRWRDRGLLRATTSINSTLMCHLLPLRSIFSIFTHTPRRVCAASLSSYHTLLELQQQKQQHQQGVESYNSSKGESESESESEDVDVDGTSGRKNGTTGEPAVSCTVPRSTSSGASVTSAPNLHRKAARVDMEEGEELEA